MEIALVVVVVAFALAFDYTNGFHDAANAIATSVSTRALTPRRALLMAAAFNLLGALLGTEVAKTIGSGIIDLSAETGIAATKGLIMVLAAVIGAICWNLITWWKGLPSSSSHALIGALTGVGVVAGVTVHWQVILDKVVIPMVASPLVGFSLAFLLMVGLLWAFRNANPHKVTRRFRIAQTLSAAAMALGHGLQDAQKTMGVIVLALVAGGFQTSTDIPLWVKVAAAERDLARDLLGRLADHADPGAQGHRAGPGAGLRGRDRGGVGALHHGLRVPRADLDDAHHHLVDHGRRGDQADVGGALGRGRQHRGGLGADHPRGRDGGGLVYALLAWISGV